MIRKLLSRFFSYQISHTFHLSQVRLEPVDYGSGGAMSINELTFQLVKSSHENGSTLKSVRSHHRDIRHNPFPDIEIDFVERGGEVCAKLWACNLLYTGFCLLCSVVFLGFSYLGPLIIKNESGYPWFFPVWVTIGSIFLLFSWRWLARIVYAKQVSTNLIEQACLRYGMETSDRID